jgi:hypothetical protein
MLSRARRDVNVVGKKPDTEDVHHQELMGPLEPLSQEIALLRNSQPPAHALLNEEKNLLAQERCLPLQ